MSAILWVLWSGAFLVELYYLTKNDLEKVLVWTAIATVIAALNITIFLQ